VARSAEDGNRRSPARRADRLADEFAGGFRPVEGEWLESLRSLAPPEASDPATGQVEIVSRLARIEAAVAEASFTSRSVLLMLGSVQAALESLDERVQGLEATAGARDAAVASLVADHERGIESLASSVSELSGAVEHLASRAPGADRVEPPVWDEVNESMRRLAEAALRPVLSRRRRS